MKFSIIVVSLNAGDHLKHTIESVKRQTCQDFEIILKDGGSKDGSLQFLEQDEVLEKCKVLVESDQGIYDAMNQAIREASGEYYLFLNCGDYLYDETVLETVLTAEENYRNQIRSRQSDREDNDQNSACVIYGNLYNRNLQTEIYAYREITPFTCYRNVPCHQTCFYHHSLFKDRGYDTAFPVRADYEHFLYCFFVEKARMIYLDQLLCSYEGAGFSETKEHLKMAQKEHQAITAMYLTKGQLIKFKLIMLLTLQPLRTWIANKPAFSGMYNGLKNAIYARKNKKVN